MDSTKARAAALVLCLVLFASLLGSLSGGLAAPLSQAVERLRPVSSPVTNVQTEVAETGALLVRASLDLPGSGPMPVQNATVKIQRDSPGAYPLLVQTDSGGEAEWQLAVGNYTVTVSGELFSTGMPVRIHQNLTTFADLTVIKLSDRALFSDLSDEDSSGSVAPWQTITMAVDGSTAITNGSAYFIDLLYGPSLPGGQTGLGARPLEQVTPVTIVSTETSGSGSSGLLWLTLRPEMFVPLQGVTSLALVTYTAVTRISYHGN